MANDSSPELNKRGPRALYRQLADIVRARIEAGDWTDVLPTEPELSKTYGVSRVTVRAAIDILVQDGLVVRAQGRGTYVETTDPSTGNTDTGSGNGNGSGKDTRS